MIPTRQFGGAGRQRARKVSGATARWPAQDDAATVILASRVAARSVAGKGFLFADRGEAPLRGFDDPVRLYALRPPEDA